jgi:hypothetical protein
MPSYIWAIRIEQSHNAILHMAHQNRTVTLWSPNSTTPLVKLLAHRGPVRALAVDREGRYMVSTGQDLKMSVWDCDEGSLIRRLLLIDTSYLHQLLLVGITSFDMNRDIELPTPPESPEDIMTADDFNDYLGPGLWHTAHGSNWLKTRPGVYVTSRRPNLLKISCDGWY